MKTEQNYIYQTTNSTDGMNPLNYFDPAEIAARLNTMFNAYMATETNTDEMKRNHWLIACMADHFQGIRRCDELLPESMAL